MFYMNFRLDFLKFMTVPFRGGGTKSAEKAKSGWIRFFRGLSILVPPSLKGKGDRGKGSFVATV